MPPNHSQTCSCHRARNGCAAFIAGTIICNIARHFIASKSHANVAVVCLVQHTYFSPYTTVCHYGSTRQYFSSPSRATPPRRRAVRRLQCCIIEEHTLAISARVRNRTSAQNTARRVVPSCASGAAPPEKRGRRCPQKRQLGVLRVKTSAGGRGRSPAAAEHR